MSEPAVLRIETLEAAEAYLERLIDLERNPADRRVRVGLEAIRALLSRIGNPERALSVVHVAGSKAKGSVCLLVEAVLRELGERVGTFTSPHLESWTERFRIDARSVSGAELATAVEAVRPAIDSLRTCGDARSPTFFDATTAVALWLFAESRLDRAVVEVGLGGRLDSTNAVTPAVTCVTGIELEHTDRLGTTLAAIAREKAGILKPRVPCVAGRLKAEAWSVVEKRAAELSVEVEGLGRDFRGSAEPGPPGFSHFRFEASDGFRLSADLPLLGEHQADNAAVSIALVRRLREHADDAIAPAVGRAFASLSLPGRCEIVERSPWVVVDSAHTPASARALSRALATLPARERHLLLSVSADKNLPAILAELLPDAHSVTLTRAEPHRSLAPAELAEEARRIAPDIELRVVPDPQLAVRSARRRLARDELLCATGSVYLAGIARRVLRDIGRP